MGLLVFLAFPSISGAETISPRRLVEVADLADPVISPDGWRVAFRLQQASIERNTFDTVWYVQSLGGVSAPRRVADGGIPLRDSAGISLPASAVWSSDGRWIYYRALIDGEIDVWRAAADGSGAEAMTHDPADVRSFSLSGDSKTLKYSVGATRAEVMIAEEAEYDAGIQINESVPIGQGLFRSGNIEGRLATQRYGTVWFDRVSLLGGLPDRWKELDLTTGVRRDLSSSGDKNAPADGTGSADERVAPFKQVVSADGWLAMLNRVGEQKGLRNRPNVQLSVLAPGAHEAIICEAALCSGKAITNIQWRPGRDEVLFTLTDPNEGMAQSIFRWDVRTNAIQQIAHSGGLISGGRDPSSSCGISTAAIVCVTAEARQPPRLEKIDLETGIHQILFEPNAALAQDIVTSSRVRLLRWNDKNGQTFTGKLYSAARRQARGHPLFVTYYDCTGFLRGGFGDEWPLATFAEYGISALCINRAPRRVDAVERYDLGRSAVESAVALLFDKGEIDAARIGMGGLSFGSEVTYWTIFHTNLLTAASTSSPAISQQYLLFGSLKGESFSSGLRSYWQLDALDVTAKRWRSISLAYNLEKVQTPILMQMPEQEYIQALDYAIPLINTHRADLYVFPNEPHQKFQPRHKLAVYERNLDWFRFWLQDYEDPDPRKAAQYRHWQEMRAARAR